MRVISPEGEQLGVLKRSDALARAQELGLDLIEISPKAVPPVAKIESWSKFKYEIGKRERLSKKKNKPLSVKEMWFSPNIGPGDLEHKIKRVKEFLGEKHLVKRTIKVPRRFGEELPNKLMIDILEKLSDSAMPESDIRHEGRNLIQLVKPK